MLPEPLHPAVVHFPMVLVFLLPIFAVGALWAIRRGTPPLRAWAIPFALAVALAASAWLSVSTGESQEDRMEAVLGEEVIHEHEEAAERFLLLSGVLALVVGVGLLQGTVGMAARIVGTVGAFALILAGVQVGAAGGELVYVHGAADAYVQDAARSNGGGAAAARESGENDEH